MSDQPAHEGHHAAAVACHPQAGGLDSAAFDANVHHRDHAHRHPDDQPVDRAKDQPARPGCRADSTRPEEGVDQRKNDAHHQVHHPAQRLVRLGAEHTAQQTDDVHFRHSHFGRHFQDHGEYDGCDETCDDCI